MMIGPVLSAMGLAASAAVALFSRGAAAAPPLRADAATLTVRQDTSVAVPMPVTSLASMTTDAPGLSCPTITKTGTICTSCPVLQCAMLTTMYNPCGCPSSLPTVTVNDFCGSGCNYAFRCKTVYDITSSSCAPPASVAVATAVR